MKPDSRSAKQCCVSKFAADLSNGAAGKCDEYPAAPIAIFADERGTK
jgi:hypothetical protein